VSSLGYLEGETDERLGNGGAPERNVGTLPAAGVEAMVGVGEADSVAPIRERGTAVGLVRFD
jgi:hypothetical protein